MLKHNEEFLDIIYKYYPKDIFPSDPLYIETPEYLARLSLQKELIGQTDKIDKFNKLKDEIGKDQGALVDDRSLSGGDLCYQGVFWLEQPIGMYKVNRCAFNISAIVDLYSVYMTNGSYYTLNGLMALEEITLYKHISKFIEQSYPELSVFPMDLFHTRVPNVLSRKRYNDYATYYECLVTDHYL